MSGPEFAFRRRGGGDWYIYDGISEVSINPESALHESLETSYQVFQEGQRRDMEEEPLE